jgi:Carboxymuconolactone decarboxylase family
MDRYKKRSGRLTIREREIVIDRVTTSCGAEYEWGVHVAAFADKAALTEDQIASLTTGGPHDACARSATAS